MTKLNDVSMVCEIMSSFHLKRLRWMRDHKTKSTDDCPASMSREAEALAIITSLRDGRNRADEFVGHHPG